MVSVTFPGAGPASPSPQLDQDNTLRPEFNFLIREDLSSLHRNPAYKDYCSFN